MKTSHSKRLLPQRAVSQREAGVGPPPLFACDSLLWIGDAEHPAVSAAWHLCQNHCDAISIRRSISDALAAPPRQSITHLVVAQTNRHERDCWAIDGPELAALRNQFSSVKTLVLRGPLVAPTVRLPAQSSSTQGPATPDWVDSIALSEAATYLRYWLANSHVELSGEDDRGTSDRRSGLATVPEFRIADLPPIVVVAARYQYAASLIDSISLLFTGCEGPEPMVQWQRDVTPRSGRGFATVMWDESVATPETAERWPDRCGRAPQARHVWMTGMASPQQRRLALEQGVHQVLDKPGRLECLVASLRAA